MRFDFCKCILRGFQSSNWGVLGTPDAGCGRGTKVCRGEGRKTRIWGYFDQNRLLARAERESRTQLVNFHKLDTLRLPTLGLTCFLDFKRIFWLSFYEHHKIAVFCGQNKAFSKFVARQCAPCCTQEYEIL